MRVTDDNIRKLSHEIFVFGSNLSGLHGGGAALTAMKWGAIMGRSGGLQGNTYAIPTVDKDVETTMKIEDIKPFVDNFISFAKDHPQMTFLVTEIGCGIAGLKPEQVAPLFKEALIVKNISLPLSFWTALTYITMSFEEWVEKYEPLNNNLDPNAPFNGYMLETYGAEVEAVYGADPLLVWTILDGDEGLFIANGLHMVNRMGYIITKHPADSNIEIEINLED